MGEDEAKTPATRARGERVGLMDSITETGAKIILVCIVVALVTGIFLAFRYGADLLKAAHE